MDRRKKPSSIPVTSPLPQPTVSVQGSNVSASLASGESVTVNLFGATVTSWKLADGREQLFLSEKAVLDGSKAIRGGIPLVFPVFGPPPANHATSQLAQHGFARSTTWEFLGKSTSESTDNSSNVKLDFGLSSSMLSDAFQNAWSYDFGLVYSVTLGKDSLETTLQVRNTGEKPFEFQSLLHTYFKVDDISKIRVQGLESKTYVDKVNKATLTETNAAVAITEETDRVYQSLDPQVPVKIAETDNDKSLFSITRESMNDMVVWNPWEEKAKGMGDFAPADGYKNMICVEAGSVSGWQTLDKDETWEGGQTIKCRI